MINKVILVGNLGRDPEIKHYEGNRAAAKFSIATNESYKDSNGEWQQQTEWHNVVLWNAMAERAERQLKKGMLVYIEGKLTHRKYQDANGVDKYITEVVGRILRTLEKRENSTFPPAENAPATSSTESVKKTSSNNEPAKAETAKTESSEAGGDLPF